MELYAYAHQLAADRGVDPQDDIMTKLVNAEIDGDRLTELEIDVFMLLLSVAGNETTRNATAHGMHALLTIRAVSLSNQTPTNIWTQRLMKLFAGQVRSPLPAHNNSGHGTTWSRNS